MELRLDKSIPQYPLNQQIKQRILMECHIVETLIEQLKAAGYKLSINDGEEWVDTNTIEELIAVFLSVGESTLRGKHPTLKRNIRFSLIAGNDGWDVIADHTVTRTVGKTSYVAEGELSVEDEILVEVNKLIEAYSHLG